ncbi:MAG: hypothetical protein RLZZ241_849 [Bacteroidota bacterium]
MAPKRLILLCLICCLNFALLFAQDTTDRSSKFNYLHKQPYFSWLHSLDSAATHSNFNIKIPTTASNINTFSEANFPLNNLLTERINRCSEEYSKYPNLETVLRLTLNYQEQIGRELRKRQMPEELLMLPAVCSGFNPDSANATGGLGYWHLNYPQALRFGLVIDTIFDDRKDLQRSTHAALTYLAHLKTQFKAWDLSLVAYRCGPSTVRNLMRRHRVTSYLELYPFLPKFCRDFVPEVLSLYRIWKHYSISGNPIDPLRDTDTLGIRQSITFEAVASVLDTEIETLHFQNPTVLKPYFPENFKAVLTKKTKSAFLKLKDSIYAVQDTLLNSVISKTETYVAIPKMDPLVYRVKSGDVLGKIAEKFGVRVSEIQQWNDLKSTRINLGQELLIYSETGSETNVPVRSPSAAADPKPIKKETAKNSYLTYTVKSGDNLWQIARKFPGVSAQNIMELNGIDQNIREGQVLKIKLR